ncbi:hypothetical protein TUM19329_23510 [Legionella antarctica]|uniref:Integrase catalytic domain-containing protein n=1 Tax=Legionella antarctica TaxID=2708020 RepID=A0A6F8T768_9GAMM|nr:IS3 family transposase [Legionella antarctica]BCA95990.1 hypothetical protein TUM19329_23510 [Legionella antarctica]
MIDVNHPTLSIVRQCALVNLSRASYYRTAGEGICTESPENLALMVLIDEEYMRHPFYGSRKMRSYLRRLGHDVNRKRVQRLMRIMGLVSVAPKPNTSKKNKEQKVYPYLLRGLVIDRPNQVWCTDITYVRMQGGFVYLVAIMDWYSRKVLSWKVSNSMDDDFCVSAVNQHPILTLKPHPKLTLKNISH